MAFQTLGTIVNDAVLQIAGVSDLRHAAATATAPTSERPVFPPEPPTGTAGPDYSEEFRLPDPGGDEFLF